MSNCSSYRIFGGLKHISIPVTNRKVSKGRKKKVQRMHRAWKSDGYQRKRAGSLSPVFKSSKAILREEGY